MSLLVASLIAAGLSAAGTGGSAIASGVSRKRAQAMQDDLTQRNEALMEQANQFNQRMGDRMFADKKEAFKQQQQFQQEDMASMQEQAKRSSLAGLMEGQRADRFKSLNKKKLNLLRGGGQLG